MKEGSKSINKYLIGLKLIDNCEKKLSSFQSFLYLKINVISESAPKISGTTGDAPL